MRTCLVLVAALLATPALAADPPAADAPVATSSGSSPSVAEQIDAYLKSSPALQAAPDAADGVVPAERKVHGEVSVGIGSHGYRSVYARTDLPVGETGMVSLAFEDTKNDFRFGPGFGRGYGYGYPYGDGGRSFSGSLSLGTPNDRQRCGLEGMAPSRPLDIDGGPHGRCVRPLPPRR